MYECSRQDSTWVTLRNRFPERSKKNKVKKKDFWYLSPIWYKKTVWQFPARSPWPFSCWTPTLSVRLLPMPVSEVFSSKTESEQCVLPGGGQRLDKFMTALQLLPAAMKSCSSPSLYISKMAQSSKHRNLNQEHVQEEFISNLTTKDYILQSLKTSEPPLQSLDLNLIWVRYNLFWFVKHFVMMVSNHTPIVLFLNSVE